MKKISCLICAYNEAERIGNVLRLVQTHPQVGELLVVDDGSTDQTAAVVRGFKQVKLVSLPNNRGKTQALILGLSKIKGPLVLLLDADLKGLTAKDLTRLIQPVASGKAGMSMSMRKNSLFIHKMLGVDFTSGERLFYKACLKGKWKEMKSLPRFGFEVFLNEQFLKTKGALCVVKWGKVSHVRKSEKRGWWKGFVEEVKMTADIVRTIGLRKIFTQNFHLWKRKRAGERTPS